MGDKRKTVLITGCSPGGIGNSLAREFSVAGLRVFATARTAASISDLAELGIETLPLELTKPESISALYKEIKSRTGGTLDFLVNNAGRNYTVPALDIDINEVQEMFEVNVFAVMRMCQTFAPLLINCQGTIVQIGSLTAVMPYVFGSAYNASKAALHVYSDTMRIELAPFGVKVVEIITGGVKSNLTRVDRQLPANSYYQPVNAEYLRRVHHAQEGATLNKDYAKSVVGKVLKKNPPSWAWEGNKSWVIWFVQRFLPWGFMDRVFWRMFNLWKLKGTASKKID